MNDYKELLSQIACCTSEESCNGCPLNSDNILDFCVDELLEKASDAIEQLCADVARLEAENRAKESYIAETIGKVIEERDAAASDQWISVKDRMPERIPCKVETSYSDTVAVLTKGRVVLVAVWDGIDWIGAFDYWGVMGEEITHWKALTPLPKEAEHE